MVRGNQHARMESFVRSALKLSNLRWPVQLNWRQHGEDVENKIAASSGESAPAICRVTSVASVGLVQASKITGAQRRVSAVLRQVAAGLAHHPDRV